MEEKKIRGTKNQCRNICYKGREKKKAEVEVEQKEQEEQEVKLEEGNYKLCSWHQKQSRSPSRPRGSGRKGRSRAFR